MIESFILFKADSLVWALTKLLGLVLVFGTLGTVALIFALKYLSKVLQNSENVAAKTAEDLGLTLERSALAINAPMVGVIENYRIRVSRTQPINRRVGSNEASYKTCEVFFQKALRFEFEVRTANKMTELLATSVGLGDLETGIPGFDSSFGITGTERDWIIKLLCLDLYDRNSPNLIADLISVNRTFPGLLITAKSVTVQASHFSIETKDIKPMIDAAIYLTKRFERANSII